MSDVCKAIEVTRFNPEVPQKPYSKETRYYCNIGENQDCFTYVTERERGFCKLEDAINDRCTESVKMKVCTDTALNQPNSSYVVSLDVALAKALKAVINGGKNEACETDYVISNGGMCNLIGFFKGECIVKTPVNVCAKKSEAI